jgi:hypothetical protein
MVTSRVTMAAAMVNPGHSHGHGHSHSRAVKYRVIANSSLLISYFNYSIRNRFIAVHQ